MEITAALVKQLRERTSAGMMECKKALTAVEGDMEAAVEHLRKSGQAKADKKAGRTAAEGRIAVEVHHDGKQSVLVEINCETDFVAKDENFKQFVQTVAQQALQCQPQDVAALGALPHPDTATSLEEARKALIAKIGENISLRRFELVSTGHNLGVYLHASRIGVVVAVKGGDKVLAKDIAMHIAASRPVCVSQEDVSEELLAKERAIFTAQAADSGKPAEIVKKMVEGQVKKYLKEITLLGQPFVKDVDQNIEQLLKQAGASVEHFVRFEVGEGLEKKTENFADEVMAQAQA